MARASMILLGLLVAVFVPGISAAQSLGQFRWQLMPYCNTLTMNVVREAGQYRLQGTDDQCGGEVRASVIGLAFQNPNGSVGFGMTIITAPGAVPVHVDATIAITTLTGTWRDSSGNDGEFLFIQGPNVPGRPPRPVPSGGLAPGSITTIQLAAAAVTSTKIADGSVTAADLFAPPSANFASGEQQVTLTGDAVSVRSVTLSVPAPGRVLANATMTVGFLGAGVDTVQCSLGTAPVFDFPDQVVADDKGTAFSAFSPLAITRGFNVTGGAVTIHLVCREFAGSAEIRNSSLTAMYVGS